MSYQRLLKWYLIPSCLTLSNIRYISRVKWNNPGKEVAPSPTPRCSSYWKGSLLVVLDYGRQLYLLCDKKIIKYILIYSSFDRFLQDTVHFITCSPQTLQLEGILLVLTRIWHPISCMTLTRRGAAISRRNTESWFITQNDLGPLTNGPIMMISCPYWMLLFLLRYQQWLRNQYPAVKSKQIRVSSVMSIKKRSHQYHSKL